MKLTAIWQYKATLSFGILDVMEMRNKIEKCKSDIFNYQTSIHSIPFPMQSIILAKALFMYVYDKLLKV